MGRYTDGWPPKPLKKGDRYRTDNWMIDQHLNVEIGLREDGVVVHRKVKP